METRGPQDDEAGRQALGESNVIRLPRDWLGPREELVPFGIGTDPDSTDRVGIDPNLQLEASDFWGEGSAAVQHALEAPTGWARPELRRVSVPRVPLRAAMVAAGVASLLAIGTMELGLTGSSRPSVGSGFAFRSGGLAVVLPPLLAGEADRASRREPGTSVRRRSAVHHARLTRSTRSAPPSAARSAAASTSSVSNQVQPPAASPDTSATSPATNPGTGSSAGAGGQQSAGATSREGASTSNASRGNSSSGPEGPGAPFGPGRLG